MKTKTILFVMFGLMLTVSSAFATPEKIEIKNANTHVKEKAAQAQLKHIKLSDIEDPAARQAIREILNYLNLQTQK